MNDDIPSSESSVFLENRLAEAPDERNAAVNGMLDLKRTYQMLADQLAKHADALSKPADDLLKAGAARIEQLETALRKIAEHGWLDENGCSMKGHEVAWELQRIAKEALSKE